jgi:hypothetical protein
MAKDLRKFFDEQRRCDAKNLVSFSFFCYECDADGVWVVGEKVYWMFCRIQ